MSNDAEKISQLYQQSATELPPPQLDQLILQQARQALKKEPKSRWWQNKFMLASAASVGFAFLLFNQYSGIWQTENAPLRGAPPSASLPEYEEFVTQDSSSQTAQRQRKVVVARKSASLPGYPSAADQLADAPENVTSVLKSKGVVQADQAETQGFKRQADKDMEALVKAPGGLMATNITQDAAKPQIEDIAIVAQRYTDSDTPAAGEAVGVAGATLMASKNSSRSDSTQQPQWEEWVQGIQSSQGEQKKRLQQQLFDQIMRYLNKNPDNKISQKLVLVLNKQQQKMLQKDFAGQVNYTRSIP